MVVPNQVRRESPARRVSNTNWMPPLRLPDMDSDRTRLSFPSATRSGALSDPQYRFPTTLAQQSFWYLDRLEPGNPCWNIAVRFRINGALDPAVLESAVNLIAQRHEILRTSFVTSEGTLVQLVHENAAIPLPLDDLTHLSPAARDAEEERRTIAEAAFPFDLKTGPLLRVRLLKLAAQEHMFLMTVHHIVSDGWSIGVFSDEIGAIYESLVAADAKPLPDLPLQYADYAIWKEQQSEASIADPHRAYWQKKLADLPACEISPDHPRT